MLPRGLEQSGSIYNRGEREGPRPRVCFSPDGWGGGGRCITLYFPPRSSSAVASEEETGLYPEGRIEEEEDVAPRDKGQKTREEGAHMCQGHTGRRPVERTHEGRRRT